MLGILGNLLAEFFMTYLAPEGVIPRGLAILSIIILVVTIIVEIIIVRTYMRKVF